MSSSRGRNMPADMLPPYSKFQLIPKEPEYRRSVLYGSPIPITSFDKDLHGSLYCHPAFCPVGYGYPIGPPPPPPVCEPVSFDPYAIPLKPDAHDFSDMGWVPPNFSSVLQVVTMPPKTELKDVTPFEERGYSKELERYLERYPEERGFSKELERRYHDLNKKQNTRPVDYPSLRRTGASTSS